MSEQDRAEFDAMLEPHPGDDVEREVEPAHAWRRPWWRRLWRRW